MGKKQKKNGPQKRRGIRKIDGMEISIWFTLTVLYVIFVMILSGWVKEAFPEITHLGNVPLDLQTGVWVFGVAMWVPVSMLLKKRFEND